MDETEFLNCWQYKRCGKDRTGGCPAYPKGGRACYLLEGTMCDQRMQGSYLSKIGECRKCDFYAALKAARQPRGE